MQKMSAMPTSTVVYVCVSATCTKTVLGSTNNAENVSNASISPRAQALIRESGFEAIASMAYVCVCSLVPRLHSPAFYRTVYKSWGVESGNEAG